MSANPQPSGKTRHRVANRDDIPADAGKLVTVRRGEREIELGVFRVGDAFRAYRNVCPHAGAPVCRGRVSGTTLPSTVYEYDYCEEKRVLRCPWHGWEFDLLTGQHLVDEKSKLKSIPVTTGGEQAPASEDLESYPVEDDADGIYVLL